MDARYFAVRITKKRCPICMLSRFFEVNSIRGRMVSGFMFLTFLIVVVSIISLFFLEHTNSVSQRHSTISKLQTCILLLFKNDEDFIEFESVNSTYFQSGKSKYLERRIEYNGEVNSMLKQISDSGPPFAMYAELDTVKRQLSEYNRIFQSLNQTLLQRGFRDSGAEGAMRKHAHYLETILPGKFLDDLLYLRRHEKDYLLRNDEYYMKEFDNRFTHLMDKIDDEGVPKECIDELSAYQTKFRTLAVTHSLLQLSNGQGLRSKLNTLSYFITRKFPSLTKHSDQQAFQSESNARITFVAIVLLAVAFSAITGHWISKKLSAPIATLSAQLADVSHSRELPLINLEARTTAKEINTIIHAFSLLSERTRDQLKQIKTKSKLLKKKNKDLKKLNRELDNFLYSTAHDLRSPLTSLLGLINLIRYENTQDTLVPYFTRMEKSINSMEGFIRQIVSYSKNKRLEVSEEEIDLHELVENVLDSHRFIDRAHLIKTNVSINGPAPCITDANRLTVILNNLVSNAIKYADLEKSSPWINIEMIVDHQEINIRFSDNGIGIEPEHLGKIFSMFYRAHHHSKGSGLGLFILHETVRKMGGNVGVNSQFGLGTSFTISLPNKTMVHQHAEGVYA